MISTSMTPACLTPTKTQGILVLYLMAYNEVVEEYAVVQAVEPDALLTKVNQCFLFGGTK